MMTGEEVKRLIELLQGASTGNPNGGGPNGGGPNGGGPNGGGPTGRSPYINRPQPADIPNGVPAMAGAGNMANLQSLELLRQLLMRLQGVSGGGRSGAPAVNPARLTGTGIADTPVTGV